MYNFIIIVLPSACTSIILRILLQWEFHLRVHLNWIIMKWKLYTFSETKFKKPLSSWERFWTQSSSSLLAVVYIAVNEPVLISFSHYHKLFGVMVAFCITLYKFDTCTNPASLKCLAHAELEWERPWSLCRSKVQ